MKRSPDKRHFTSHLKKNKNSLSAVTKSNSVFARIRKIGNSRGIILSSAMIKELGVEDNAEVTVTTENGQITIKPLNSKPKINTDLSTWEAQFKAAIKAGDEPEADMFEGIENEFDTEEW